MNYNSLQGDKEILDIIEKCSGKMNGSHCSHLHGITVDVSNIPDLVPILTVLFCFCEGTSKIVNAGRLRLKESDRLHAITTELNKLGANIEEGDDYLIIHGINKLHGGLVHSHNDHRIAMSLAIASIKADGEVIIENKEAVNKSYPGFWEDFEKI